MLAEDMTQMAAPKLSDIYNFQAVTDNLGTAGQPTSAQFDAVKDAGYEVVINLAMGNTPRDLPNEPQLLADHGIDYVHIPVVFDEPTQDNLNQFFDAMDAHQDQKCFVHCIANARVSAFVMLYRVLRQGIPVQEADATMRQIWEPNPTWQAFIDERLAQGG
jgi:protein tyrosine phosphatase (PTP) superfamily phosphohydrolase (DUF442 family)